MMQAAKMSTTVQCSGFGAASVRIFRKTSCGSMALFFFLMIRRPPRSTLFPYNDALPICKLPDRGESLRAHQRVLGILQIVQRLVEGGGFGCFAVRERFDLGSTEGNRAHFLDALKTPNHQDRIFECDPEGVFEKPPPLGVGNAVDRLGPEESPEKMVGRHHDRRRNEHPPVSIESQKRERTEHVKVCFDASASQMNEQCGPQHL